MPGGVVTRQCCMFASFPQVLVEIVGDEPSIRSFLTLYFTFLYARPQRFFVFSFCRPPEPSEVVRRLREECLGQHLAAASAAAPGGTGTGSDALSASGVNDDGTGSAVGGGGTRSAAAAGARGGGPSEGGSEALVVVSGGGQGGHETVHLANHFYGPQDLSLKDDAPIALFEYIEQQPLVMHNPGMAVRIVRHFFPPSPPHADLR